LTKHFYITFIVVLLAGAGAVAQSGVLGGLKQRIGNLGGQSGGGGKDSLHHRTGLEDSITIHFRYLDSSRYQVFDSSIDDFSKKYPIPPQYVFLGNTGNAAKSMIFSPTLKAGWDAGFHAFDVYTYKPLDTRFFNTTRPYTELGYLLGSKAEQMVTVLHTQNINPNWNVAFQFRLINSPGYFKNQNASHSNYRLSSYYQSPNRRYHLFFVLLNNKLQSSENGGIINNKDLDNLPTYNERSTIPVHLGPAAQGIPNPFTTKVETGNKYKVFNFLLRQQYDLGIKDSVVTDSTVIQLFYPKLRMEYTFQLGGYTYSFEDAAVSSLADTAFYRPLYNFIPMPATYKVQDKWDEVINDFSIYQFPDSKNPQQFFKAGASLQNLKGTFDGSISNYYNTWIHGEYRNKTRNQKWDVQANGELYLTGLNAGDYNAAVSLKRLVSKKLGSLQVGFQNVNRTPSFIFNSSSSFNFANTSSFNKENITRLFGAIEQPQRALKLSASYYFITNYSYFNGYYKALQASGLFNLLQLTVEKETRLRKHLYWSGELTLQQKAGNVPVNVPLVYTRHRIGYKGNLGFKSLNLATGIELRYNTPYKADGYSPVLGQFYYQDTTTVTLKLPTVSAYFHFRIRSFTAYIRMENLNTARTKEGFGFTNNNPAINGYFYPGMQFRVGIFWSFVN
jgi:hypothetical protein